jgi:hypothetical protein
VQASEELHVGAKAGLAGGHGRKLGYRPTDNPAIFTGPKKKGFENVSNYRRLS